MCMVTRGHFITIKISHGGKGNGKFWQHYTVMYIKTEEIYRYFSLLHLTKTF